MIFLLTCICNLEHLYQDLEVWLKVLQYLWWEEMVQEHKDHLVWMVKEVKKNVLASCLIISSETSNSYSVDMNFSEWTRCLKDLVLIYLWLISIRTLHLILIFLKWLGECLNKRLKLELRNKERMVRLSGNYLLLKLKISIAKRTHKVS